MPLCRVALYIYTSIHIWTSSHIYILKKIYTAINISCIQSMYICMYTCVYIYIYVHIYVYKGCIYFVCVCVHTYLSCHICVYINIHDMNMFVYCYCYGLERKPRPQCRFAWRMRREKWCPAIGLSEGSPCKPKHKASQEWATNLD